MTQTQTMAPSQPLKRKPEVFKEDRWSWDLAGAHLSPTAAAAVPGLQELLCTAGKRECRAVLMLGGSNTSYQSFCWLCSCPSLLRFSKAGTELDWS